MSTRLYLLTGEDEDETKVWYSLNLGMEIRDEFLYEDVYKITKLVPTLLSFLLLIYYYTYLKVFMQIVIIIIISN